VTFAFLLPILMPPITYGIPLATVLYKFGFAGNASGVVLANLVPSVPFVILTMTPFIEQINPSIESAARMCGAGVRAVFLRVLARCWCRGCSRRRSWCWSAPWECSS
jgi:putative spermidine/putrescine transport system permease protein